MKLLVLNGPNLNMTGRREPEIYGTRSLDEIIARLSEVAEGLGVSITHMQTNHEGVLIDELQAAPLSFDGVLLNKIIRFQSADADAEL